ncbi:MAG: hypothetical protein ACJ8F7_08060 [Gemmataceae bacterium]
MIRTLKWALPVCLGATGSAFLVVFTYGFQKNDPPPPPSFAIAPGVINVGGPPPETTPVAAPPADTRPEQPVQHPPAPVSTPDKEPPTPATVKWRWTAFPETSPGKFNSAHIRELTFDPSGRRVVTHAHKEIKVYLAATGKLQHTFTAGKREPIVSPDGRFIALLGEDMKSMTLYDTATCREITTSRCELYFWERPAFTPWSDWLVMNVWRSHGPCSFWAISTSTGRGQDVDIPDPKRTLDSFHYQALLPVPDSQTFIVDSRSHAETKYRVWAFDLKTGKQTPVTGITIEPWIGPFPRGLRLSPDGKLLLAWEPKALQVCEWRSGKRLLDLTAGNFNFSRACFTPDGKRLLVTRQATVEKWIIGGADGFRKEQYPNTVELYELATKKQLGHYETNEESITAIGISADGKTLALADRTVVTGVDFEAAFGVAPLSPVKRPARPETAPGK